MRNEKKKNLTYVSKKCLQPQPLKEHNKKKRVYHETQFSTLEKKEADALEVAEKTHQKREAKKKGPGFIRSWIMTVKSKTECRVVHV